MNSAVVHDSHVYTDVITLVRVRVEM